MTTTEQPQAPRWLEYRTVDDLPPADRNAKDHDQAAMRHSVAAFGFIEPVVLDERTGQLLGGHGRSDHLAELEADPTVTEAPEGIVINEAGRWMLPVTRGWRSRDDNHANAAAIALNHVGELGGWVPDTLAEMLDELRNGEDDLLDATGFSSDYLDDLISELAAAPEGDDADGRAPSTGEMLALADVTFGEPTHVVHHGQVWRLGRHTLVVAKLHREHHLWREHLVDGVAFAPYPEPYITTTDIALEVPLLLVQPNVFLAGHLLDKHAATHPADTIALVPG